ncbi:MAG: ABC transporter permease subunit [Halanaeroarchaeum sp.]
MRTLLVARKEFVDATRSRTLWAIVGLVAVMTTLSTVLTMVVPGGATVYDAIGGMAQIAGALVPIVALVAAYLSIAGERESGSIKVLLGLPPTRGSVLLGKFLARGLVVVAGILAGYLVAAAVTVAVFGGLPLTVFVGTAVLAAGLGVVFVGIAIGISAATASRSRAVTFSVAVYLLLTLLWDLVPQLLALGLGTGGEGAQPWLLFVRSLSPTGAFNALIVEMLGLSTGMPGIAKAVDGPVPFYLQPWAMVAILVLWTAIPVALGYRAFERADIN